MFAAELGRILTALQCVVAGGGDSSDEALFLAAQIIESVHETVDSDARCAEKLKYVLEKVTSENGLLAVAEESGHRPSQPSPLRAVALGSLGGGYSQAVTMQLAEHTGLMPASAAAVLDQLNKELADGCFHVSPFLWRMWLAQLRAAEPYCCKVANPSFRSMAGFWLYRDRQLDALRRFGDMYAKRMKQSDLSAALRNTPHLRAAMCGMRTAVWPHTVLTKRAELP